jgi:signal transduction histidine kinase
MDDMSAVERLADGVARSARDAIELLVEVLSVGDVELDRQTFYSRLAEGVARVAEMRRVVIFRFDEVTRRVDAAGSHGLDLELFADVRVSLELAPDAARALAEDRVIEVRPPTPHAIPSEFASLVGDHPLVYVPIAAGGRWPGVIIAEPAEGSPPLEDARREWLWRLGKTLALASITRTATFYAERSRELERRIELARDLHERVVQRLFGVSMALTWPGALDEDARGRCAEEVQGALGDLRSAIQRPLGAEPKATHTTLAAELERLAAVQQHEFAIEVDGPVADIPSQLERLMQSVFAEAVRNVRKHAHASKVVVRVRQLGGLLALEIENDGVGEGHHVGPPGVGLRIAALEALQVGGLLEFGASQPGRWHVRLAVPLLAR